MAEQHSEPTESQAYANRLVDIANVEQRERSGSGPVITWVHPPAHGSDRRDGGRTNPDGLAAGERTAGPGSRRWWKRHRRHLSLEKRRKRHCVRLSARLSLSGTTTTSCQGHSSRSEYRYVAASGADSRVGERRVPVAGKRIRPERDVQVDDRRRCPMKRRLDAGFTLIELMLVVCLIGIIAAIALPALTRARAAAVETSTIGSLRAIHSAQAGFSRNLRRGFLRAIDAMACNAADHRRTGVHRPGVSNEHDRPPGISIPFQRGHSGREGTCDLQRPGGRPVASAPFLHWRRSSRSNRWSSAATSV